MADISLLPHPGNMRFTILFRLAALAVATTAAPTGTDSQGDISSLTDKSSDSTPPITHDTVPFEPRALTAPDAVNPKANPNRDTVGKKVPPLTTRQVALTRGVASLVQAIQDFDMVTAVTMATPPPQTRMCCRARQ